MVTMVQAMLIIVTWHPLQAVLQHFQASSTHRGTKAEDANRSIIHPPKTDF